MVPSLLSVTPRGVRVAVRVQPRSSRNRVVGRHGTSLRIQVQAAPVDGAANQAVIDLLADWLAVPRRAVSIGGGLRARDKVVVVASEDPQALAERVRTRLDECVDKAGRRD